MSNTFLKIARPASLVVSVKFAATEAHRVRNALVYSSPASMKHENGVRHSGQHQTPNPYDVTPFHQHYQLRQLKDRNPTKKS
ncbi:uncharacterized protein N7496_003625 [Penicillium cataractarum]|uniref:Uncharacterized protein n=1 Tax=Penicillium cataractarum TaxID=2100454 RepID=A0A9W9SMU2_9EURO|nr:uncharacterized protein N7496_003625 [Penicillium cataractarum]KAJ5381197.1 hypothetical protein N7496_003625 [Penicillium cataractarum]